ncbi:amino acid ABC transporter permease [Paenibacillus validus]|uniref:ABC transporter permease subunit n=1 Tax=Paenibacillus validus TaxID=44253 RepID=A0A7X3CSH6_9BACL|nr:MULTISPECIES: amino acid ABC transporter permease [Paenibacillus]MED4600886.1 amino acid ABC transporter permease [Paenibacillus validus]MED4606658.1 amino acid ABC transporter permease [Paenibacillus validus]MUG69984.1 ABC transporter permease subunit [Paenibacillus validus]
MGKPFDFTLIWVFLPKLLSFLHVTLFIVVASVALGVVAGIIMALPRLYKIPVLNRIVIIYISYTRGTPILIQMFLVYYGLPELLKAVHVDVTDVQPLVFVILTYALHFAAYFSEIVRASVNAVDRSQAEAGYSIGMGSYDVLKRIVLPQAWKVAFPNVANLVISTLKDTSLAYTLGVMDVVGRAEMLGTTYHFLEIWIALSIIYYSIVLIFEYMYRRIEHRLNKYEKPVAAID